MKSKSVKILIAALLAALCVFAVCLLTGGGASVNAAEEGDIPKNVTVDNNYFFEEYDVEITVRRDKTYYISEKMSTHFFYSETNTGIIRDIQQISQTTRITGGKEKKGKEFLCKGFRRARKL